MSFQRFQGMTVDTKDVLEAMVYRYTLVDKVYKVGENGEKPDYHTTWTFRIFILSYHDYHTGFAREKFEYLAYHKCPENPASNRNSP